MSVIAVTIFETETGKMHRLNRLILRTAIHQQLAVAVQAVQAPPQVLRLEWSKGPAGAPPEAQGGAGAVARSINLGESQGDQGTIGAP